MIDQILKIASEDKSNAEKLAFVDEVLSQNFEFKDELIVEQQDLLERVDESLEKLGALGDVLAGGLTGGLHIPISAAYGYMKGREQGQGGSELDKASIPGLALSPLGYGAYRIAKGIGHQSGKVENKLGLINTKNEKIAEMSPEAIQTANTFGRTLGGDVVESLARNRLPVEKQASMSAGFKQGLGLAGAGIAGMVGTALVNDMYSAAKSALTKGRNFERMVQAEPELKQYPADKVKAYFNTLHEKGGPEMSGDPVLAAAFVKQQLDFHGSSIIDQVNKIVGIRENLHKSQGLGKLDFMSMTKMKPQQE